MKCRLIGDLETMCTIGRGIMNVSRLLPHVLWPVFSDGKPDAKKQQLRALTGKHSLFHSQIVQRIVSFVFSLQLQSSGLTNGFTDKSFEQTLLHLNVIVSIQRFVLYCTFIVNINKLKENVGRNVQL